MGYPKRLYEAPETWFMLFPRQMAERRARRVCRALRKRSPAFSFMALDHWGIWEHVGGGAYQCVKEPDGPRMCEGSVKRSPRAVARYDSLLSGAWFLEPLESEVSR